MKVTRAFIFLILAGLFPLESASAMMNTKSNAITNVPVILVSGDNPSKPLRNVTSTWSPGFIISYASTDTTFELPNWSWGTLTPSASNWFGNATLGTGVAGQNGFYTLQFTAAQLGTIPGYFYYFVSVDGVSAPYYGMIQVTGVSTDNVYRVITAEGAALGWGKITGQTTTVNLSGTRVASVDAVTVVLQPVGRVLSVDQVQRVLSVEDVRHLQSGDSIRVILNPPPTGSISSVDSVGVVLGSIGRVLSVDQVARVLSVEDVRHLQSGDSVRVILDPVGRVLSADQVQRVLSVEDVRHLQSGDSVRVILNPPPSTVASVSSVDSVGVILGSVGRVLSVDQVQRVLSVEDVRHLQSGDSIRVILDPIGRVLSVDQVMTVSFVASADSVKMILQPVGRVLSVDQTQRVLSVEDVRHLQSGDSVKVVLDPVGRVLSVDQTQRVISAEDVRHVQSVDSARVVLDPVLFVASGIFSIDNGAVGAAVWGRVSSDFTTAGTFGGQINSMDRRIGKPNDSGTESIHGKIGEQNKMSNDLADSIRIHR